MNKKFFLVLVIFLIPALLSAGGNREKDEKPLTMQIKGIVRLVGTSHFPEIVISAAEMEWFIPKGEAEKLWDLQNRIVTLEGIETVRELKFASGMSAGVRREIRDVKVLGVE